MPHDTPITVILPAEGESWGGLLTRMKQTPGEILLVLSGRDEELTAQEDARAHFLKGCAAIRDRLRLATKQPVIIKEARALGMRVLDRTKYVKLLLSGHPQLNEALRVFAPHLWRQQIKSRLQRVGLLSIPRLRIGILVGLSIFLFLFVVLRLLPSATVTIKPRDEPISQTMNLLLVQSGAAIDTIHRVRTMPLIPLTVRLRRSITSDSISKEFIGTSATVAMTIVNASPQAYSLKKGTRMANQAGMIFRLQEAVTSLPPGKEVTVHAKADDMDLYEQIIGERGNVPAGLKWEIPGLAPEERTLVYGENRKPAAGGTTAYRRVLRKVDLDLALHRLEQQLLATAKENVESEKVRRNATDTVRMLAILSYPELTKAVFSGATLPLQDLGKEVSSFTVEQTLTYTALSYDSQAVLAMLSEQLQSHAQSGKQIVEDSLAMSNLDVRVISYDDNLSWVKLTVELVGRDRFILDPLTPAGALFGKKVREKISGMAKGEALRIIRNMPEVEQVTIRIWPPWQRELPAIPANISISPQ